MEKNWLIRTQNKHLLGPVTKDKVKDLIGNGSLKSEDEICSGNGYWFFVKEKDCLDKYIYGEEIQDFNPVQEAPTVLAYENSKGPSESDLEYPDMDDITVANLNLNDLKLDLPEQPEEEITSAEDEAAEAPTIENKTEQKDAPKAVLKATGNKRRNVEPAYIESGKKISFFSTYKFYYLLLFIFIAILGSAFLFKNKILKEILSKAPSILIEGAYAQSADVNKKKSGFLT